MKMKTAFRLICTILTIFIVCVAVVGCDSVPKGKAAYDPQKSVTGEGTAIRIGKVKEEIDSMSVTDFVPSEQKSDYVLISVEDYGDIVVVLRRDVAPDTVKNFKKLVAEGFYNGTVFHRVIENFMIQGGGYTVEVNGTESSFKEKAADSIKGEFNSNNFTNNLLHVRGVISMARANDYNSASSQFFIMHEGSSDLNGKYAAFGYVLAGMDVVDAIATCKVTGSSNSPAPVEDVVISSITFVEPK